MQYGLEPLGALNNYVLGPELSLSNLSLTSGTTNTITETLNPATQTSLQLNVSGSQWASAFNNVGPSSATVQDSIVTLIAEPNVTGINASGPAAFLPGLVLVGPTPGDTGFLGILGQPPNWQASTCLDYTGQPGTTVTAIEPPILTDQDFGTLQYGDPFDPTWTRALALCQQATVPISVPNSSSPYSFVLVDGISVAPSSSSLLPLALPVQNPTINGTSVFTEQTISNTTPMLSWSAPTSTPSPYGYTVRVYVETTLAGTPLFDSVGNFSSSATSVALPPLQGGNTYLFAITTEVDGAANMQTSPFRSALPTGFASIVSAPITIAPAASAPQILGDIQEWRRLVKPSDPRSGINAKASSSCFVVSGTLSRAVCEAR